MFATFLVLAQKWILSLECVHGKSLYLSICHQCLFLLANTIDFPSSLKRHSSPLCWPFDGYKYHSIASFSPINHTPTNNITKSIQEPRQKKNSETKQPPSNRILPIVVVDMPTQHDWNGYAYAINYTCTSHEAGVPYADILAHIHLNGYPNVELETLEGWVSANQRPVTSAPAQTTSTSRNYPTILLAPANNHTAVNHTTSSSSHGEATAGANPTMPPSLPPMSWDARADRFAMSAHRVGTDIATITDHLNNNGYDDASLNDVIRSLTRQGVTAFHCSRRWCKNRTHWLLFTELSSLLPVATLWKKKAW